MPPQTSLRWTSALVAEGVAWVSRALVWLPPVSCALVWCVWWVSVGAAPCCAVVRGSAHLAFVLLSPGKPDTRHHRGPNDPLGAAPSPCILTGELHCRVPTVTHRVPHPLRAETVTRCTTGPQWCAIGFYSVSIPRRDRHLVKAKAVYQKLIKCKQCHSGILPSSMTANQITDWQKHSMHSASPPTRQ